MAPRISEHISGPVRDPRLVVLEIVLVTPCLVFIGFMVRVFFGSFEVSPEAKLNGNLHQLRNAIEQYYTDTRSYPITLTDLTAASASILHGKVKKGSYQGPYLSKPGGINGTGIPKNPFALKGDTDITHHWTYNPKTGEVRSAVTGKTIDDEIDYTRL